MPTVIRSRLADIFPAIRARLAAVTGFPPERVLNLQREDPPFDSHGDSYVYVRVENSDFDMANILGAGRIDAREALPFSVVVRTRYAVDEANQDVAWLLDPIYGHAELRRLVLDAMMLFQPLDGSGNWLATEPIKPAPARQPRKDEGRNRPNKEWGQSELRFVVTYELDLSQDYQ